jgi:hypothetical protein
VWKIILNGGFLVREEIVVISHLKRNLTGRWFSVSNRLCLRPFQISLLFFVTQVFLPVPAFAQSLEFKSPVQPQLTAPVPKFLQTQPESKSPVQPQLTAPAPKLQLTAPTSIVTDKDNCTPQPTCRIDYPSVAPGASNSGSGGKGGSFGIQNPAGRVDILKELKW